MRGHVCILWLYTQVGLPCHRVHVIDTYLTVLKTFLRIRLFFGNFMHVHCPFWLPSPHHQHLLSATYPYQLSLFFSTFCFSCDPLALTKAICVQGFETIQWTQYAHHCSVWENNCPSPRICQWPIKSSWRGEDPMSPSPVCDWLLTGSVQATSAAGRSCFKWLYHAPKIAFFHPHSFPSIWLFNSFYFFFFFLILSTSATFSAP